MPYYPPTGFRFRVEFIGVDGMNNDGEQRFQEVSGLSFDIEFDEVREGGENRFTYKFPKRVKYPNLVLKRGLLKGTAIQKWVNDSINSLSNAIPFVSDFKPADLIVTLLDEADDPVAVWDIKQAFPLKWSTSDFKSTDNSIVVETFELSYQFFERKL
ncbi:MAG: phage tail protein [Bacteroidetes bacterium]|nr:phage tail protein [Bacteroidota bacterium]